MTEHSEAKRLVGDLARAEGHAEREPIRERLRALGPAARPALVAALDDNDPFTRWEAVSLLGEEGTPEAAGDVARFALGEHEVHARWRSFWAVSRFPHAAVAGVLLDALRDGEGLRRWNAALALAMLRRPEAGDALVAGLGADDEWTQWEALASLRCLPVAGAEDAVGALLGVGRDPALRREAALALGSLGGPRAVALLQTVVEDRDPEVRWRAAMAMERARDRAA